MATNNGRRISVPNSGVYGRDIIRQAGTGAGRRLVIKKGIDGFETVNAEKHYSKRELTDRKGNMVKITDIPQRIKGSFFSSLFDIVDDSAGCEGGIVYGGRRSSCSKRIIREQVYNIADKCFKSGVDFDEENCDWMVVPRYVMPKIWKKNCRVTPLLVVFPTFYPEVPPVGCYLKEDIPQSPDKHLYAQAYHDACKNPLEDGWKWYCVYVKEGTWMPSRNWRSGDNIWTYFTLINEALSGKDD